MDYSLPDWWKRLPCHLSPTWNLKGQLDLDVRKLKQKVDWNLADEPHFMPIENLLYRAFLEVPPDGFLMKGRSSPEAALAFLGRAEDHVEKIWAENEDVQNNYKLVINAFRMWLYNDGNFKESSRIEELNGNLKRLHEAVGTVSTPHIDVVLATALRRLGRYRYDEAISLLDKAIGETDDSRTRQQWQFCKANLIGRNARSEQKSAREGMTSIEKERLFGPEKTLLQSLLHEVPPFAATARAHLGMCLYDMGEKKRGLKHLEKAYRQSPNIRAIALKYGRVLRYERRYGESKRIFYDIRGGQESVEISFQLGKLHQQMAKDRDLPNGKSRRRANIETAFTFIANAVSLDQNHIPALGTKAELLVSLGRKMEARRTFFDIFRERNISPEQLFFERCLVNRNPRISEIFSEKQRLDNAYQILLLCIENYVEADSSTGGQRVFTAPHRLGTDEAFKVINTAIDNQSELGLDAMRLLSDIKFRLGDFRKALELSTVLQKEGERPEHGSEILWRRGKCLCALGEDVAAEDVAKLLQGTQGGCNKYRELSATIHLTRAKSELGAKRPTAPEDQRWSSFVGQISPAINYGSIEACHVLLGEVKRRPFLLCREDSGLAGVLADIKQCLGREDSIHRTLPGVAYATDDGGSGSSAIEVIENLMRDVLTYPKSLDGLPHLLKSRYESLTNIRGSLVDFEYTFKYTSKGKWDSLCQAKAEKTLTDARNLLDHTIYSYQRAVLDKKPTTTNFPIHNRDTKNKSAGEKLDGYLQKYFYRADPPIPEDIKRYLISLQPISDPDNGWRNALSSFVNDAKHTGSDYGDTIRFEGKLGDVVEFKKEELVRRSCCRVEAIVAKLLDYVEGLFLTNQTKTGFLLGHEQ